MSGSEFAPAPAAPANSDRSGSVKSELATHAQPATNLNAGFAPPLTPSTPAADPASVPIGSAPSSLPTPPSTTDLDPVPAANGAHETSATTINGANENGAAASGGMTSAGATPMSQAVNEISGGTIERVTSPPSAEAASLIASTVPAISANQAAANTPQTADPTPSAAAIDAPIAPPAPISQPEVLPPPPVVPLPTEIAQQPKFQTRTSDSSIIAQPGTPGVSGNPPPVIPSASSTLSAAPISSAETGNSAENSVFNETTPAATPSAVATSQSNAIPSVDVKMEESAPAVTAGDVSPSLLKRAAPENLNENEFLREQISENSEERELKRQKIEIDPIQSTRESNSLPPQTQNSLLAPPTELAPPTMSPAEMHHSAPATPSLQNTNGLHPQSQSAAVPAAASPYSLPAAGTTPSYFPPAMLASVYGQTLPHAAATTTADSSSAPAANSSGPLAVFTRDQQKFGVSLLRNLKKNKSATPFLRPVDPIALFIPDYPKVITQPMDLGTVEMKLGNTGKALTTASKAGRTFGIDYTAGQGPWEGQSDKVYRTAQEFHDDVNLIWDNCFRYNGPAERNPVSAMAAVMKDAADKMWRTMPAAPLVEYKPEAPRAATPQQAPKPKERRASVSVAAGQIPPLRHSEDSNRPKREIHAPARDAYYADPDSLTPQQQQQIGHNPSKSRTGRVSGKQAQEQLRFCKEVIKELNKKTHEPYAFPFYYPVDFNQFPQYPQFIKEPMDLATIKTKLENGLYPIPPYDSFQRDVRLIFSNCYTFNPAGNPVHDMGKRLEAVFEQKWGERPIEHEEVSDDDGIGMMEQQLAALQQNIEQMKQNKKLQKEQQRVLQHAQHAQQRPHKPKKDIRRMSSSGSQQNLKRNRPAGSKKSRKHGGDNDEDFYDDGGGYAQYAQQPPAELVTFEMKRELALSITTFEGENLERAIDIIRRGDPELLGDASKEIELDIDQLDQQTLLNLYRFVCPNSAAGKIKSGGQNRKMDGRSNPNNKRKNLDELKEAERIEMLEARLREFENQSAQQQQNQPDRTNSLPAAGGAAAHGDQASSDSSSDDGSDSDSDDED